MTYDSKRNRLVIPMNDWNAITIVELGREIACVACRRVLNCYRLAVCPGGRRAAGRSAGGSRR